MVAFFFPRCSGWPVGGRRTSLAKAGAGRGWRGLALGLSLHGAHSPSSTRAPKGRLVCWLSCMLDAQQAYGQYLTLPLHCGCRRRSRPRPPFAVVARPHLCVCVCLSLSLSVSALRHSTRARARAVQQQMDRWTTCHRHTAPWPRQHETTRAVAASVHRGSARLPKRPARCRRRVYEKFRQRRVLYLNGTV